MKFSYAIGLLLFLLFSYRIEVTGTHLRAADILVEKVNCTGLTYKITLIVYVNTTSGTRVGGFTEEDGHITFGDGALVLVPILSVTQRPDLGVNVGIATTQFFHTYSREGTYRINYYERDRSSGVLNIPASLDVPYSTYIQINAKTSGCNSFPVLTVAPLDRSCSRSIFFHNPGAVDADGDSISYELSVPSKNGFEFVDGYISPVDRRFYANFDTANEAGTGPPTFSIDAVSGLITWDAPGMQGQYNIAFKVLEWKKDPATEVFVLMSTSIRDMQIVVEDCLNNRPVLNIPADICVEAGQTLNAKITGSDFENHPVKIEVFSSILTGGPETLPATINPMMTDFVPSSPPAEVNFEWKTDCIHVRDQYYQVLFKITDQPPKGPKLVTFATWNIKVIGSKPKWVEAVPDLLERTSKLKWEPYFCANADKIEIWRKVSSSPFLPGQCVAGLSKYKGYQLIATVDPSQTDYLDTNNGKKLSVAAQYCYRLVAVFPAPALGKSYVSDEICLEPILADAPIITHVSIEKTDSEQGVVRVKWLSPFGIDKDQYPEPYEYEIYRANGFENSGDAINVSGRLKDLNQLSYDDVAVNTSEKIYNYTIVLYSKTRDVDTYNAIDTSATASTVRLSVTPGIKQFKLEWQAETPWSNVVDSDPWHYIYRGIEGTGEADLELIDSVDVSEVGFEYVDIGKFQNTPIREDRFYCYAVITKGSYGNRAIPVLYNRSQMVCLYPEGNLPPCSPVLTVDQTNCENFLSTDCLNQKYYNQLNWIVPEGNGCRSDIVSFDILYASQPEGDYILLKNDVTSTSYRDENLISFARCYRIQSKNSKGVLSALTEPSCNENCPSFDLPNIFTPNGDGCNDVFAALNGMENTSNQNCLPAAPGACPRFVQQVIIKVMNRWGRLIYEYRSDDQHSILINWDGKDQNGQLLESGVYYYTADVQFDTLDASKRSKQLKGSIHLMR
jgi:hypothetical protein